MKLLLHDYGNFPFIRQLARSLAMRGHDVHFVYSESTQLIKRSENGLPVKNLTITGITLKKPFEKYDFLRRRACEIEHGRQLA